MLRVILLTLTKKRFIVLHRYVPHTAGTCSIQNLPIHSSFEKIFSSSMEQNMLTRFLTIAELIGT